MSDAPLSNAERSRRTRRLLLDVGRELFAEKGYAHTSTEEILQRTGCARGAIYYHFQNKPGFFAAVFEDVRADCMAHLERVIEEADGDLWQRLVVTGCRAFVDSLSEPTVRRIVHVGGPAVLSWSTRYEQVPGPGLLQRIFRQLTAAGLIEPLPLGPLVSLFWALFFEAGTYVAAAENREQAREEMIAVLIRVFEGLRPPGQ